jgi:hypothetical protein
MKSTEAKENHPKAPDLCGAEAALRRAAQRAKEIAEAHGLKVLVYKKDQSEKQNDTNCG